MEQLIREALEIHHPFVSALAVVAFILLLSAVGSTFGFLIG